jgi:CBS-domain-containing membrane protein
VMRTMKQNQVRRVLVVDDDDSLIGVIAQADIAVKEAPSHPEEVAETVEKISEPAKPQR